MGCKTLSQEGVSQVGFINTELLELSPWSDLLAKLYGTQESQLFSYEYKSIAQ